MTVLNMAPPMTWTGDKLEMLKGQIYGSYDGPGLRHHGRGETDGGYIKTNFDEYIIPTSKDMPNIIPVVENPDPDGPFGAKSIEPTLELGQLP